MNKTHFSMYRYVDFNLSVINNKDLNIL